MLVFLHALPLDGRMWDAQRAVFSGSIAPTLYGLGPTLPAWACRVVAQTRGRLVVVGNSVGVSCALEMARVAADRIDALVLVGGKAAVRHQPDLREEYLSALRSEGLHVALDAITGPVGTRARALAREQAVDDVAVGINAFHTRPDAAAVLAAFPRRVVVVQGELDGIGSVTRAAAMAASAPRGELVVVPDAGHYVNLDQPDVFNEIVASVG